MLTGMAQAVQSFVCPTLIGREGVLDAFQEALDAAARGRGQTLILTGEAGIGKSRLAREARQRAERRGFSLLQGRCFDTDRSLPYGPWLDFLRSFFDAHPLETLDPGLRSVSQAILALLPELGIGRPQAAPGLTRDADRNQRRLLFACDQFCALLAARRPLLLTVEDLHWSDEVSLDALRYLAYHLSSRRTLLLLTYRDDEAPPALRHFLAELDRERLATEITLARFTAEQVDEMARAVLGLDHALSLDFLGHLYALTEGNPFFVEEVLKSLSATGDVAPSGGRWHGKPLQEMRIPRTVRDAVRRRVEPLSAPATSVLSLAAVAGRQLDYLLLRQLSGLEDQPLLQAVQELVAAQLLVEVPPDGLAFRHALTREAVYASLLQYERQSLHARVAQAVERLYRRSLDAHLATLAHHYHEAGSWERALDYGRRAGEQALALHAPREALQHFTRALGAAERSSIRASPQLWRMRALAYETVGDFEAARADQVAALQMAEAAGDAREQCEGLLSLGQLWASRDYEQAAACYARALDLARSIDDRLLLGRSLNRVGNWYANIEQPGAAVRFHREALGIFEELGDAPALARTLDFLGMASHVMCDPAAVSENYCRAIELFQRLDDRAGLSSSLATLTVLRASNHSFVVGTVEAFPQGMGPDTALQTARDIGWRAGECYALFTQALYLGARGRYAEALDAARSALHIAEEIGHQQWLAASHNALGVLYLDMLNPTPARQHMERALELAKETRSGLWPRLVSADLAAAYIQQNQLELAKSLLDAVLAPDAGMRAQGERVCWSARAELALARADPALARQIAERLIGSAPNPAAAAERAIPRIWHLRARALAALGRDAEAEAILATLRDAALADGVRAFLWRVELSLGRLFHATRRYGEARDAFDRARGLAQELARDIPDDGVRQVFRQNVQALIPPAPRPTRRDAARRRHGGLTPREWQVAQLIAQGKSNRDIAEALVVSLKTVEGHVSNVLSKLGMRSRAQVAAWAAQQEAGRRLP